MRLSNERIKALQLLLKEQTGKDYSDEQAQEESMAILRFIVAKAQHEQELIKKMESNYGQSKISKEA